MALINYLAISDSAKEPSQSYRSDFCYDLTATSIKEISPNVYEYSLGMAIQIDRNKIFKNKLINWIFNKLGFKVSIDIRPRSSIFKTGLVLANSVGTIDELYRGELKAIFYQVVLGKPIYEVGDRVAQCKLGMTLPIDWIKVDHISSTDRGAGGFGSTGK